MKIFLIGFMGSGKTHWGRLLSEKIGLRFFDLDDEIENAEQKKIVDIFEEQGEENFRLKEKEILHILTESHESFVMACGGGTPCYFNNIEYMNRAGISVWIHASMNTLVDRLVKEKEKRPLVKKLPDHELRSFIIRKYADRKIYYEQATIKVEEENLVPEQLIDRIFHA